MTKEQKIERIMELLRRAEVEPTQITRWVQEVLWSR